MPGLLDSLTLEFIASGLVGLITLGVIVRSVLLGWVEARSKLQSADRMGPLATAVSMSWDKDQIERALQAIEAIAEAMELQCKFMGAIAESQGVMSDQFQQTTQTKLNELLDRLDNVETRSSPQPRRRRTKPKSTA